MVKTSMDHSGADFTFDLFIYFYFLMLEAATWCSFRRFLNFDIHVVVLYAVLLLGRGDSVTSRMK